MLFSSKNLWSPGAGFSPVGIYIFFCMCGKNFFIKCVLYFYFKFMIKRVAKNLLYINQLDPKRVPETINIIWLQIHNTHQYRDYQWRSQDLIVCIIHFSPGALRIFNLHIFGFLFNENNFGSKILKFQLLLEFLLCKNVLCSLSSKVPTTYTCKSCIRQWFRLFLNILLFSL